MLKTGYTIPNYMRVLFYVLTVAVLVIFTAGQLLMPREREKGSMPESIVYAGSFVWERADGTEQPIELPGIYEVAEGETMIIKTRLPENFKKTALCIRGSQQTVRFYIDGDLRAEYDTEESRLWGSESASRYVFCPTSREDAGKELEIRLTSNSDRYSGVVNEVYWGDKTDIWMYLFDIHGMQLINALFVLFMGIVTVIFSLALGIAYRTRIHLEYLGWCMILGAAWLLGESKLRQLMVPNVSGLADLYFAVILLCPLPLLFYVDSVQQGRYRKLFTLLEIAALADFFLVNILQMAEVADYLDTLWLSHVMLGSTCLAIIGTFCVDWYKGRIREYILIVIGLLAGMLGALAEVVSVYFVITTSGFFLGTGLLLLLIFAVIKTIQDIRELEGRWHREQLDDRRKQMELMSLQMIRTLSDTIEAKDEYTRGHSRRVAEYAALMAEELGWSREDRRNLKNAAYLHDVGKIAIPDNILNKPTRLLDGEYEVIKEHTVIGAGILKNVSLIENAEKVARYHHERYDGKGYPEGLEGEEIPIEARIVAVADSYDAMNSKRIYRNPMSMDAIRKELIRNRGLQFDPALVDVFLKLLDENRIQAGEKEAERSADIILSELKEESTLEAGEFFSNVVDTMKSQRETENIDFLTGLPMRNLGERQIARDMQEQPGCLVFLDMDNLKKINDIYGHKAGDKVLKLLGDTISDCGEDSVACRLGGDEFLLFVRNIARDDVEELVGRIFEKFNAEKEQDVEIRCASLSGGLCMTEKGDLFADCYMKADKALYYIKQNGKNNYSFYHQIEQDGAELNPAGRDLEQVAKALRQSGNYTGALDIDSREFAKLYEYMSNLGERYRHTCHLVMITMDTSSDNTMFIEKIEQALNCMEMAIRRNIRNVDVCTRYSSMQYLVILMEVGEENISMVTERIFHNFYSLYNGSDFQPRYEYLAMGENLS